MRKRGLLFCAILLIAICNTPAAQVPQEKDTYRPTATIREVMATVVEPSANHIWSSVRIEVSAAGISESKPQNDKEWSELRRQTLMLVEATNLLAIPGRPVAKAGEKSSNPQAQLPPEQIEALINRERANWVSLSHGLHDAATQALAAVEAKDSSALLTAGGRIYEACKSCHAKYWNLPARP
jgi:hypothetical protein